MFHSFMSKGLPMENIRSEIQELAHNWVNWINTRRFYCPPIPQNMLARMQVDRRPSKEPPNARNDALCSAFNTVMVGADPQYRLPFLYVYLKQYRPFPVKSLAAELGVDSDTIYYRAHFVAPRYFNQALKIARDMEILLNEPELVID